MINASPGRMVTSVDRRKWARGQEVEGFSPLTVVDGPRPSI